MIIFRLGECEDNSNDQDIIDRADVGNILMEIEQGDLVNKIKDIVRLGKKDGGKIRPLKVVFLSSTDIETVITNAYKLKGNVHYRVSLCRDLIREDREMEKAIYLRKKQERQNREEEIANRGEVRPGNAVEDESAPLPINTPDQDRNTAVVNPLEGGREESS